DAGRERSAAGRVVAADRPRAQQVLGSGRPFAVFRLVDRSRPSTYGRLSIASLDGRQPGAPIIAGPACSRVAFAAGEGVCLDVLGTGMDVELLDRRLRLVHEFQLAGIPSRARVSPDGRWGGVTAFLVGHAYAAPGTFSTAATIIDMRT